MGSEMNKGLAIGMLISFFLLGPILGALRIGSVEIYVTIGLAIYLFLKN